MQQQGFTIVYNPQYHCDEVEYQISKDISREKDDGTWFERVRYAYEEKGHEGIQAKQSLLMSALKHYNPDDPFTSYSWSNLENDFDIPEYAYVKKNGVIF